MKIHDKIFPKCDYRPIQDVLMSELDRLMNEREIPQDLKYAAIQHSLDQIKAQYAVDKELANHVEQVHENYKKEISEFLGSKATNYFDFYEKRAETARRMRPRFTATPEGDRIKREFLKSRLAEANEFFKNLGVNVDDIKSIRKKYSEEFRLFIDKRRNANAKEIHSKGNVDLNSNPEGL